MATKKEFEELYLKHYTTVYYTALQLMGEPSDAEDMTQEAFITAFMKYGELKEADSFGAWVKRIVINKCLNELKRNKPVLTEDIETEQTDEPEENENFLPEDHIIDKEKRETVFRIMKSVLSKKQFITVVLFYYDGLSVAEIAKLTDVPEGTVLSRLSVSRGKIKKGVLEYEEKNHDKLYGLIMLPFLTRLFAEDAKAYLPPAEIPSTVRKSMCPDNTMTSAVKEAAKKGFIMKSKIKLVLSIAAAAATITVGGILIKNAVDNKKENDPKRVEESNPHNNTSSNGTENIPVTPTQAGTENPNTTTVPTDAPAVPTDAPAVPGGDSSATELTSEELALFDTVIPPRITTIQPNDVFLESESLRITYLGLRHTQGTDAEIQFLVENLDNEEFITFSMGGTATINGWDVPIDCHGRLEVGEQTTATCIVHNDDLIERGITSIDEIFFYFNATRSYNSTQKSGHFVAYPTGLTPEQVVVPERTAEKNDQILFDNKFGKFIVLGTEYNDDGDFLIHVYVENKTKGFLFAMPLKLYIGDSEIGFLGIASQNPYARAFDNIEISKNSLEKNNITDISDMQLTIRCTNGMYPPTNYFERTYEFTVAP